MATFSDREKGFEEKFRRDQELQFRVFARRNKLLGLWAAEKLGLAAESAEQYTKDVVASDFAKPGDEDVLDKVANDLAAKGLAISRDQVRQQMNRLLEDAKRQISAG
jgi:hypothetical protein